MKVSFFAVNNTGVREEITDLYWFEENGVRSFADESVGGQRVEVVIDVPRCETCAHFERDDAYVEPAGRCNEKSIWSDCNDYTIYVSADFGCIKWKERT